jgi:hypothetical protein
MIKSFRMTCIAATLFMLGACSHTAPAQIVDLGDAGKGWRITCGGIFLSTGDCYDKASYQCTNRGYTIMRETDISPPPTSYWWNSASAHEIVVRCS